MRLKYVTDPTGFSEDSYDKSVENKLRERRGESGLIPLDLTLLHSPVIADGWNSFFGAIRQKTSLNPLITEIIICRIASLNRAWFEWNHHVPILRKEGGLAEDAVDLVKDLPAFSFESFGEGKSFGSLGDRLVAVLAFVDASTVRIQVKDEIFEELRKHFNEREIVEITATTAGYNCVSRFLVALDVGECNEVDK